MVPSMWRFFRRNSATRKRHGGTHHSPTENFETMRLLKQERRVDILGRWWLIETRHDIATGLVLRSTRRITE